MVNTNLMYRLNNSLPAKVLGESKETIANYKGQLLKSLQIGDILEGIVINKIESGYVLELNSGMHIPVFLLDEIDLGKILQFKVENNKQGEIFLSVNKEITQSLTQKVIEELGLTHTPEMEECVKQFIAKELPLTKESLLSTHYLHRQYQIPKEVIINAMAKSNQLTEKEVQNLFAIKEQGIDNILKEIKQNILQIEDVQGQFEILKELSKQLPKEDRAIILNRIIQTILKQEIAPNTLEGNLMPEEIEKTWMKIVRYLESGGNENSKVDIENNKVGMENNKIEIENILRQDSKLYKEGLKTFIERIYDKAIGIDVEEFKEPLQKQLEQFSQKILKVIESGKLETLNEIGKDTLTTLKQGALVLQKLNIQGDYFLFPFMNNTVLNKGEIYFFEPRKQLVKGKKSIYIVIALDLSMINHLEIHINKIKNKLSLNIMVETEDIKNHITKYMSRLLQEIQDMGYQLEKCTYTLQDPKKHKPIASYIEQKITAFDMKI